MDKLFIDTNIFESKGFNFDERNILIKILINNAKGKKYEYCNLSIIDNEIKSHINKKSEEDEQILKKKYKWLKQYVDDKTIYRNCYKNLIDYEDFKKNINAVNCDVSGINAEDVFKKYFSVELPFEIKETKRKEFPDAFISMYINKLAKNTTNKIYFISEDKGLKKSLDDSIIKYDSVESFLTDINGLEPTEFLFVRELIKSNIVEIGTKVLEYGNFKNVDLEDEEIEPDSIILNENFDFEVMDADENEMYINCIFQELSILGTFSCLDYENSYWPNDEEYYVYTEYLKSYKIDYENFEISLKIRKEKEEYKIEYDNIYNLEIDYKKMKECSTENFSPFNNYDGEDSWTQDNVDR